MSSYFIKSENPIKPMKKLLFFLITITVIIKLVISLYMTNKFIASDSYKYLGLAKSIIAGKGFVSSNNEPFTKVGVFYGVVLSALFKVGIINHSAIIALQSIALGLLLSFIFLKIHSKIFGVDSIDAPVLFFLLTFYPTVFFSSFFILTEMLFTVLLYASSYLFILYEEKKDYLFLIFSAVLLAFAALTRSMILFFPFGFAVCAAAYSIYKKKKFGRTVFDSFVFLFFFCVIIMPWTLRNYLVFKKFIPITTNGGGIYFGYLALKYGEENVWKCSEMKEFKKAKTNMILDKMFLEAEKKLLREKRAELVFDSFKRFFVFWLDIPGSKILLKGKNLILVFLKSAHYSLLLFSFAGILFALKEHKKIFLFLIFICYYAALHSATFANGRYRFPIEPVLLLFAYVGAKKIIEILIRRNSEI